MGAIAINMIGRKFGRLTVIERVPIPQFTVNNHAWWRCKCDCGTVIETSGANLRRGSTRSCGCLRRETAAQAAKTRAVKAKERRKENGEKVDSD